ncbi:MAG: hypothetical protein R3E87_10220 [Burkholderiaceae bacterium]
MITEIVSFTTPVGMTREQMLDDAQGTVERWTDYPGLVRKMFVWDAERRRGMGIYLWQSREQAEIAHDDAWLDRAERHWGNRPDIERYDCFMILENPGGEVVRPAIG